MTGLDTNVEDREYRTGLEVAVIGMAARVPGAGNIDEFWENMRNGVESVSFFTDGELEDVGVTRDLLENPDYVKAKGVLEDIEYFDAPFFDYSPREAGMMDPQLRLFHECAWGALECAGYDPRTYGGLIGVYAGAGSNLSWLARNLGTFGGPGGSPSEQFEADNINSRDYLCTQVAYKLDLSGPAVTVQTACSTSLVAVHQACQALTGGDCDIALAGGVSISLPKKSGYLYQEGLVHSPDGHCRAFDAGAGGTVPGDGIGIVVLKRLDEAVQDGDFIYAVIRGSAVNNDGSRKVDFTAPGVKGQAAVISAAYHMAEVDPGTVTYVETHGTGTALGDPIEMEALKRAFKAGKKQYCAIGAIKSNIGHLIVAAGIAGFIKTVLALAHRLIPPSPHFNVPNPDIDLDDSPFYVNTGLTEWKGGGGPLRAGVSSFGIGGTNAHVVLEEAPPPRPPSAAGRDRQLFLLSAKTETALTQMTANLQNHLEEVEVTIGPIKTLAGPVDPADIAYTLQVGRAAFSHRKALVCRGAKEAVEALSTPGSPDVREFVWDGELRPVVFMFPGQGAQYVNMGLGLYRAEPLFREQVDLCFDILKPVVGYDMKTVLYPAAGEKGGETGDTGDTGDIGGEARQRVNQTQFAQPLIFIFEYALARLLMEWGIRPYGMIGHSIGEYTAACLSGVISLEDALTLVALRGKWVQEMPPGSMAGVSLPEERLLPYLNPDISLAAVNSSSLCTVSGTGGAVDDLIARLEAEGHKCTRLRTSHAFHSPMMDPVKKKLEERVRRMTPGAPQIPYISNLTGKPITAEETGDPAYWADHLRAPVRFSDGAGELLKTENAVFIEVGPGRALSTFIRRHDAKKPGQEVLNLVRHPKEDIPDTHYLLTGVGELWLSGVTVDWSAFHAAESRRRVPLPTYPFERLRYWPADNAPAFQLQGETGAPGKPLRKKPGIADWFYIPSWKRSKAPAPLPPGPGAEAPANPHRLLFVDDGWLGQRLAERLERAGRDVVRVKAGPGFSKVNSREYTVDPAADSDYDALFDDLQTAGRIPGKILHLWGVTGEPRPAAETLDRGYYSLLNLARLFDKKGIDKKGTGQSLRIAVVTDHMQDVTGGELLYPEKAAVLGPVSVIPGEFPGISCRSIDIPSPAPTPGGVEEERLIQRLAAELEAETVDSNVIAFRGLHRWVRAVEPAPLEAPPSPPANPRLKHRGVYLITGGLGGMGLVLGEHLAKTLEARLVLIDRAEFPAREQWDRRLSQQGEQDPVNIKILKITELEAAGGAVLVCRADAADLTQMRAAVDRAKEQFGKIDGVIHAAGLPDGALIRRRTREMSEDLFASKIHGTLVLDRIFKDEPPDFFFLCSSLLAFGTPVGQVGYCAANAFLDAFAHRRFSGDGRFTVSVNWDGWKEVGMAVDAAARRQTPGNVPGDVYKGPFRGVDHPLFTRCTRDEAGRTVYISRLNPAEHWVLDEHRVMGDAVLPGTAYLEMVTAALLDHTGGGGCEIREIYFMVPLTVNAGEDKEVYTVLEKQGEGFDFRVKSRGGPGAAGNRWQEHAAGKITPSESLPPVHDIETIEAACNKEEISVPAGAFESQPGLVAFGPRWNTLRQVKVGDRRGLAMLELPGEFTDDLETYRLHPALMDFAVSFMAGEFKEKQGVNYLPFSYKNVTVHGPLPRRIFSHITPLEEESGAGDGGENKKTVSFNVTVMDERGVELVRIDAFTMIAVDGSPSKKPVEPPPRGLQPPPVEEGISSAEGIDVFLRVLADTLPQVLVSTVDLEERHRRAGEFKISPGGEGGEGEGTDGTGPRYPRPRLKTRYVEPSTGNEHTLARIWGAFLRIDRVGVHDDFFDLGGDSLKAITITGKIHKETGMDIPISDFFNNPTIAALARLIDEGGEGGEGGEGTYSSIRPMETREYYPQSSAQKRLFILDRFENVGIGYNTPILYKIKGTPDKERLERTFLRLIERHEGFRTSFHLVRNEPVQRIHKTPVFRVEEIPSGTDPDSEDIAGIVKAFVRPFDLSEIPLLRVGLTALPGGGYLLLIDIHHIIADGTSVGIFMEEFIALYRGESLAPPRVQYKDFALWQAGLFQTGKIEEHEAYWLQVYADAPDIPRLNLDTDFPRPKSMDYRGDCFPFRLEEGETSQLKKLCADNGVTLYMALSAVFNVLLYKYTGQTDIVVGSHTEGRLHPDTREIVGMFVNSLAMRNYPGGKKTYKEFLAEVKTNSLKAFENQDLQFEDLVHKLNLGRDSGRNPLFDVVFNVQNFDRSVAGGNADVIEVEDGISITPYEYEDKTSKFDMILFVYEVEGGISFNLRYSTLLFRESTMEKLAGRYIEIVRQVVADENVKLEDIKISHDFAASAPGISDTEFRF